jgi:hypothetical protein
LLALAGLLAAARPAAAGCRVKGEHAVIADVVVRADPSTTFEVGLSDIPARATIGAGSRARLDVSGAIAFQGTRENVWLTVARPVTVANGMVRLTEGAQLLHARADGDGVVASVGLWAEDVLPGENKDADDAVVGVRVPCRALRLGGKEGESDDEGDDGDDADSEAEDEPARELDPSFRADPSPRLGHWQNVGSRERIVVRAAPKDSAAGVTLTTSIEGEGLFDFEGVEERGDWLRVRRAAAGAEIRGWIRRAELVAMNGPMGRGTLCIGNHGTTSYGRGWEGKPPVIRYQGPARLRVGASIEYGEKMIWAKVRRSDGFQVLIYEGYPYAELTHIPGVWVPSWFAMVDLADVTLPEGLP